MVILSPTELDTARRRMYAQFVAVATANQWEAVAQSYQGANGYAALLPNDQGMVCVSLIGKSRGDYWNPQFLTAGNIKWELTPAGHDTPTLSTRAIKTFLKALPAALELAAIFRKNRKALEVRQATHQALAVGLKNRAGVRGVYPTPFGVKVTLSLTKAEAESLRDFLAPKREGTSPVPESDEDESDVEHRF